MKLLLVSLLCVFALTFSLQAGCGSCEACPDKASASGGACEPCEPCEDACGDCEELSVCDWEDEDCFGHEECSEDVIEAFELLDLKREYEEYYTHKLSAFLGSTFGYEHVRVSVFANISTGEHFYSSRTFDPESQTARSKEVHSRKSRSGEDRSKSEIIVPPMKEEPAESEEEAVALALAEEMAAKEKKPKEAMRAESTSQATETRTSYEISEFNEQGERGPGSLEGFMVAILLDEKLGLDKEQINELRGLCCLTVGISPWSEEAKHVRILVVKMQEPKKPEEPVKAAE